MFKTPPYGTFTAVPLARKPPSWRPPALLYPELLPPQRRPVLKGTHPHPRPAVSIQSFPASRCSH